VAALDGYALFVDVNILEWNPIVLKFVGDYCALLELLSIVAHAQLLSASRVGELAQANVDGISACALSVAELKKSEMYRDENHVF
jgi:hypothetical protein